VITRQERQISGGHKSIALPAHELVSSTIKLK
jgi:hypothetical protein